MGVFFAACSKRYLEVAVITKDLCLADDTLVKFLTTKYALCLYLRASDDY